MKSLIIIVLASIAFSTIASAQIPVEIFPVKDADLVTQATLKLLKTMISQNSRLRLSNDTTNLRIVLHYNTATRNGATALTSVIEICPPNSNFGIYTRGHVGIVGEGDFVEGVLSRADIVAQIYRAIFIDDRMLDKMEYIQRNTKTGSLDELATNLQKAVKLYGLRE